MFPIPLFISYLRYLSKYQFHHQNDCTKNAIATDEGNESTEKMREATWRQYNWIIHEIKKIYNNNKIKIRYNIRIEHFCDDDNDDDAFGSIISIARAKVRSNATTENNSITFSSA